MEQMYAYSWHEDKSSFKETIIRIYGITIHRETICVNVKGFTPWVMIELPTSIEWDQHKIQNVSNAITNTIRYGKPVRKQLKQSYKLYGLNGTIEDGQFVRKMYRYLKFYFNTKKDVYMLRKNLIQPLKVAGLGTIQLKLHETKASTILQLCSEKGLSTAGWLRFIGEVVDDRTTIVDREYIVDVTNHNHRIESFECMDVVQPKIMAWDIETGTDDPLKFPDPTKPNDVVFQISCIFSRDNGMDTDNDPDIKRYLLSIGEPNQEKVGQNVVIRSFTTECNLIKGFVELIQEEKPNVTTGFNTFGFDIHFLMERAKLNRCLPEFLNQSLSTTIPGEYKESKWSSSAYKNQFLKFMDCEGILPIDMMIVVQRDFKLDSYSLKNVSSTFLKTTKIDLNHYGIHKCYKMGMGSNKVKSALALGICGEYCVKDSILVMDLFKKLNVWLSLAPMARTCAVPMSVLYTQGQQVKVYSQIYRFCYNNNIVVEDDAYKVKDGEHYAGAYVVDPVPGIFKNVVPLDFSSLYPSIIQAYNVDYSTFVNVDTTIPNEYCHIHEWEDHYGCEHDPKEKLKLELGKELSSLKNKLRICRLLLKLIVDKMRGVRVMDMFRTNREIANMVHEVLQTYDVSVMDQFILTTKGLKNAFKEAKLDLFNNGWSEPLLEKYKNYGYIVDVLRSSKTMDAVNLLKYKRYELTIQDKKELMDQAMVIENRIKELENHKNELIKKRNSIGSTKHIMCDKRLFRFVKGSVYKGVLPSILDSLLLERKKTRLEMASVMDEIEQLERDPLPNHKKIEALKIRYVVLNKTQLAFKVSANSMYGITGVREGMLPFMPVAMTVTYLGRTGIRKVMDILTHDFGCKVVYGDTDSSYVSLADQTDPKAIWNHALYLAEEVSKHFPKPIKLEFEEAIYSKFLILTKKRYMYKICTKEGVVKDEMGKRGVLSARRDNSLYIRNVYKHIVDLIFEGKSFEEVMVQLMNHVINLYGHQHPYEEFMVTKSVNDYGNGSMVPVPFTNDKGIVKGKIGAYTVPLITSKFEESLISTFTDADIKLWYLNRLPGQVQLMEKIKRRGHMLDEGSRLSYVVTDLGYKANQSDKVESAAYFHRNRDVLRLDYGYYLERLINPLDQLFEAVYGKTLEVKRIHKLCSTIRPKLMDELKGYFKPTLRFED